MTPQLALTSTNTVLNSTFGSDHHPIRLVFNLKTCTPTAIGKNFNKINKEIFQVALNDSLEEKLHRSRPATCIEEYALFVKSINITVDASTPDRKIPKNNKYKSLPYCDDEIRQALHLRSRARNKWAKLRTAAALIEYKRLKAAAQKLIRQKGRAS